MATGNITCKDPLANFLASLCGLLLQIYACCIRNGLLSGNFLTCDKSTVKCMWGSPMNISFELLLMFRVQVHLSRETAVLLVRPERLERSNDAAFSTHFAPLERWFPPVAFRLSRCDQLRPARKCLRACNSERSAKSTRGLSQVMDGLGYA